MSLYFMLWHRCVASTRSVRIYLSITSFCMKSSKKRSEVPKINGLKQKNLKNI